MTARLPLAGLLAVAWLVSCRVDALLHNTTTDPPGSELHFAATPDGTAGASLTPAVTVSAVDTAGTVDTTFSAQVTVTLGDNPGRGALAGTRTVPAVRGVARFTDLSINRSGTGYTLVATAPGLRGVTSPPFDIAPAPAARLAFTAQPHDVTVDSAITPAVQVAAFDTLGNVATSFAANITLALAPASSGATLGGTATLRAASGAATFADLRVNKPGTGYTLTASASGLTAATSDAFTVTTAQPTTGSLTVATTTTGQNPPSGYTVTVDGGQSKTIGATDSVTYAGLPAGTHSVALGGVPPNCAVTGGGESQSVSIPAGGTARASFSITCQALTGSLTVTTATTGSSLPTSDYSVTLEGGGSQAIHPNGSVTFTGLGIGSHTVTLAAVPSNCVVSGGSSQTVTVPAGGTATAGFTVTCSAVTGSLTVKTSTSGANQPGGYSVTVDGGSSKTIGASDSVTYSGIAAGNHSVRLNDVPANCSVSGMNPRTVTVPAGSAAQASFSITCQALTGSLTVTTATTGSSLPTSDYTVAVDGGSSQPIHPTGSASFTGLSVGTHTVTLAGVPANCSVSGGGSQSVSITANGTAQLTFTISCVTVPPPTGSVAVTTTTSGDSPDPDGYTVTLSGTGGGNKPIGTNETVTFSAVSTGDHSVTLSGVAANCTVTGGASQTVTVTANQTAPVTYAVSCTALPGALTVTTSTTGPNAPTGYTFSVDGGTDQAIGPNTSVTVPGVSAGPHTVRLNGVPANCSVSGGTSQAVTMPPGGTATASFTTTCQALTGDLTVSTSTSGSSQPSGYTVTVDGGQSKSIGATSSVTYAGLAVGDHAVQLNGVPANCSVSESNPQTVTVSAGATAQARFGVSCTAPPGSLTVSTATSGSGQPSGYSVTVDGGQSKSIGATDQVTYPSLAAGSHTVELGGVPGNCSVAGGTSQTVSVPAGGSTTATFSISCAAPNQPPTAAFTSSCTNLDCSFTDQSSDADGSVTAWQWNFGDGQSGSQRNPSHTYTAGGTYTVTLTVTDNQNASSSPVSHQVSVTAPPPPNQPPTAEFSATCTDLQCRFTDGSSDPDGSVTTWQWNFGDGGTSSSRNPSHGYGQGGTYTVTLTVTDNDGASNSVSHAVTVSQPPPPDQPPSVTAGADQHVLVGALFSLSGASFSDPDHDAPWTITIDWGDGSSDSFSRSSEGSIGASHSYITVLPNTYTLTVTVTDSHGLSASASKNVSVTIL